MPVSATSHATRRPRRPGSPARGVADHPAGPRREVARLLFLQRQAGNRAVSGLVARRGRGGLLQRQFMTEREAREAFGDSFDTAMGRSIAQVNALIADLPVDLQRWMESLNRATRLSLLHQVDRGGGIEIVRRICANLESDRPARLPDPADDSACWRFLLDVARAHRLPEDLGMLGRLPEWVAKLKLVYAEAETHVLERDLEGFHRATVWGRRHLADVRSFVAQRRESELRFHSQAIMAYLTRELSAWLAGLYRAAAASLGLTGYALLAVGSVGREEMFPHSDVDYTVLVSVLSAKVSAVDKLLALALEVMGEPALDEIGKGAPEEVATRHVVTARDVLMDARTLYAEGTGGRLAQSYYDARRREVADDARRQETATSLIDTESTKFSTRSEYLAYEDKDVKKGLLRLPTFVVRNLCFYHARETASLDVWARVADLVKAGILAPELAVRILQVVEFASYLRLKLHSFHRRENDTFRLRADVDEAYQGYVLSGPEEVEFRVCEQINADLEKRCKAFSGARYATLRTLQVGATLDPAHEEAPTDGPYRDCAVRVTPMTLADGRRAVLREVRLDADSPVIYLTVTLDGAVYLAHSPDGALATRDSRFIYSPSDVNPFASL